MTFSEFEDVAEASEIVQEIIHSSYAQNVFSWIKANGVSTQPLSDEQEYFRKYAYPAILESLNDPNKAEEYLIKTQELYSEVNVKIAERSKRTKDGYYINTDSYKIGDAILDLKHAYYRLLIAELEKLTLEDKPTEEL